MYVLYNIQGNVLLTKLMRKLYQILYTVGRLTYAPARRAFSFLGDTWAVGVSLSGGHLSSGQVCEGERRSELRSPLFPLALPLSGHVTVLRCSMLQCIGKCLYAAVLAMYSCADGCVVNVTPNSSYLPYPREQARCAGRFPVRRNKKIGSA